MKTLLRLEDAAKLLFAFCLTLPLGFHWWVFWAWFLAPDISILAYVVNTRVGAAVYNLFHHQALALGLVVAGLFGQQPMLQFAGLVLFGHSAFDRVLGYGLKFDDDFKHTHLGWIGKGGEK